MYLTRAVSKMKVASDESFFYKSWDFFFKKNWSLVDLQYWTNFGGT